MGAKEQEPKTIMEAKTFADLLRIQQARSPGWAARQEAAEKRLREIEAGMVRPSSHSWFWYKAEIPQRFLKWSLGSSPVDAAVKTELAQCPASQSWLLWGEHGVGKTGLAIGWLRHRMGVDDLPQQTDHIVEGRFVTLPDLLSQIKAAYGADGGTEASVMQEYREVPTLVIDDMGAEHVKGTGWLEDILYQLIGYRHDNLMPAVFTSNLSPQALGERISERVMWRLVEMCGPDGIVELRGLNLRERKD